MGGTWGRGAWRNTILVCKRVSVRTRVVCTNSRSDFYFARRPPPAARRPMAAFFASRTFVAGAEFQFR